VVWLAIALTAPAVVERFHVERLLGTLAVVVALAVAAWLAPRAPGPVGVAAAVVGTTLLVALAVPDDDTRHLRRFLFEGAYIQDAPGREHYAFQPVEAWGWPTFVLAASIAAILFAAALLMDAGRRRQGLRRVGVEREA
jgi:hypothetical protein